MLRRRLREPEFLRSAADRSIEIEKLARPFFPPDPDAPRPTVWDCYEAERRGLENGDIPKFETEAGSTTLFGDGGIEIPGYFWKTGWQVMREKLAALDEATIREQSAFVRASLAFRRVEVSGGEPAVDTPDWIAEATAIAEDIASRTVPLRTGGISWLAPSLDPVRKMQTPGIMGLDLYSGSLGVAIFLAALWRLTGEARWKTLAENCTRPRLDTMHAERMRPFLVRMSGGLATGLGSLAYGCQVLGNLLGDERFLDDAEFFAALLDPEKDDGSSDLLQGGAGAVMALLNLHAAGRTGLEKAMAFGEKLLSGRVASVTGHRAWQPEFAAAPLTGLGHGAAGYAWALHRLGRATGEARFLDVADEAVAYERAVFDAEADNWPDFRRGAQRGKRAFMHGWCSGPPGIGLARLALPADGGTAGEIETALRDATGGPALASAHLCCGCAARVEFLLEAAQARDDENLRTAARRVAGGIVAARRRDGFLPLLGADRGRLFAPSFFQGTAGIGYTFLRLAHPALPSIAGLQFVLRRE